MMPYKTLPIILKDMKILLIGGGKVALQKAEVMQRNGVNFAIVSKEFIPEFQSITAQKQIKEFAVSDVNSFFIVVDATGSKELMQRLLEHKHTHNFLYNCVDVPEVCDFFFAALVEYGSVKVAVSSSGASPTLAKALRDKIKRDLPKNLALLNEDLQSKRTQGIINMQEAKIATNKLLGKVYLVGCGTGDVELLTMKAYKLIKSVDVVFLDHLIAQEIIDIIPQETQQIFVGKQKGFHSIKQEEINAQLKEFAQKGLTVARLKSGDPYVFGRGSEEALSMVEAGITVEVVPGISSAIAGPLLAGIAPTARGYATNMSIVSAHLAGNRVNLEWIPMLKYNNHTVVVLMGISRAREIRKCAQNIGVDMQKSVAVISNASRSNQSVLTGTLAELDALCKDALRPALIVIGDVVNLHDKLPKYEYLQD